MRSPSLDTRQRLGFTLLELLVVVAIIALLISILLPALQGARDQSQQLLCNTNLKSMGEASYFYAEANHDYIIRGEADRAKREVGIDLKGPKARGVGAARACQKNLQIIQSAKREVVKRKGVEAGGRISWDNVNDVLKERGYQVPIRCPSGGRYQLHGIDVNCRCSIGANGTADPADDHIYRD